jgi:hypothetical protein
VASTAGASCCAPVETSAAGAATCGGSLDRPVAGSLETGEAPERAGGREPGRGGAKTGASDDGGAVLTGGVLARGVLTGGVLARGVLARGAAGFAGGRDAVARAGAFDFEGSRAFASSSSQAESMSSDGVPMHER